jgi:hypothetical protein
VITIPPSHAAAAVFRDAFSTALGADDFRARAAVLAGGALTRSASGSGSIAIVAFPAVHAGAGVQVDTVGARAPVQARVGFTIVDVVETDGARVTRNARAAVGVSAVRTGAAM